MNELSTRLFIRPRPKLPKRAIDGETSILCDSGNGASMSAPVLRPWRGDSLEKRDHKCQHKLNAGHKRGVPSQILYQSGSTSRALGADALEVRTLRCRGRAAICGCRRPADYRSGGLD